MGRNLAYPQRQIQRLRYMVRSRNVPTSLDAHHLPPLTSSGHIIIACRQKHPSPIKLHNRQLFAKHRRYALRKSVALSLRCGRRRNSAITKQSDCINFARADVAQLALPFRDISLSARRKISFAQLLRYSEDLVIVTIKSFSIAYAAIVLTYAISLRRSQEGPLWGINI